MLSDVEGRGSGSSWLHCGSQLSGVGRLAGGPNILPLCYAQTSSESVGDSCVQAALEVAVAHKQCHPKMLKLCFPGHHMGSEGI